MATTSTASNASEDCLKEAFNIYFDQENEVASLKRFHEYDPTFITRNSDFVNVQATWVRRFRKQVKERGVRQWNKDEPEWTGILEDILKQVTVEANATEPSPVNEDKQPKPLSPTSSSPKTKVKTKSSSSGSKGYSLSESQKKAFEAKHEQLDPSRKWRIGASTVEDKLHKFAQSICNEHAAHSMILNLADTRLQSEFTINEIAVLENHKLTPLPTLPNKITDFFKMFKGKDLEEMWNVADNAHFDPVQDFDLDWAKRSILDILSAYRWGTVAKTAQCGGERDLIMLIWRCVDTAFQNIEVQTLRSDQQTQAGSARANEDRLSTDGSIKTKVAAVKPDLILTKNGLEYGAAENGFADESGVGEKELSETFLKLPKTLKDMILRLAAEVENDEGAIRSLRVVGLVHTHLRVTAYVMDIPDGYVCRIRKIKEYRIPETLNEFYDTYIAFLEVVLKLKGIVVSTIETIRMAKATEENRSGFVSSVPKPNMLIIPSALNGPQKETPKKRKFDEADVA